VCLKEGCGGWCKPDVVFYGENLPPEFFTKMFVSAFFSFFELRVYLCFFFSKFRKVI
jgi:hypothetical protein